MKTAVKLNRTLAGVREALFDQIDALRAGTSDSETSTAVAILARGIIDSAKLQLEFEKAWAEKKIADKLRAIELVPSLEDKRASAGDE